MRARETCMILKKMNNTVKDSIYDIRPSAQVRLLDAVSSPYSAGDSTLIECYFYT